MEYLRIGIIFGLFSGSTVWLIGWGTNSVLSIIKHFIRP